MHILCHYLLYLLRARHGNGHGIHSPFVFDFIRSVLCGNDTHDYSLIRNRRRELMKDWRRIAMEEYGEGSRTGKMCGRQVRYIVKTTAVKPKYGRLLTRLVSWYEPDAIIELGTGTGISSLYLAAGCHDCTLFSVEGAREIHEMARQTIQNGNAVNVELIYGLFNDELDPVLRRIENKKRLMVFIDGDHNGTRMLEYIERVVSDPFENMAIILDDIYWSASMKAAWEKLISRADIAVTIDLFQFGILFFKKGIAKQHYMIRF
jgi:predicted O-methyltransferase YrrM